MEFSNLNKEQKSLAEIREEAYKAGAAAAIFKQCNHDVIKTIDEELKEVRHCLELAKEQMLIDYVYVACEHLDNIEKLKGQK